MTDPEDPHDSRRDPAIGNARPSGLRLLRVSSRPPSSAEWTLGQSIDALTTCQHPEYGLSSAVVVEPDGSRIPIRWCGACGSIALSEGGEAQWIRPGLALLLGEEKRLSALARDVEGLADAMAELTKAAKSLGSQVTDQPQSPCAELSSSVQQIEYASIEIERGARAVLRELVPRARPC
ncbi:MAG TPA: hypothetical protein VGY54_11680 [Polyangiaceae bacterium]|jgi:hypothetical protein|nr:hypothetical protein [Polyangiaceae bacterium]